MNICNILTGTRALGAVVVFTLLALYTPQRGWLTDVALVVFIVSAFTDYLDGVLARRLRLETTFGRIADPFTDKLLVCGTFVFLLPLAPHLLPSWVVAVVIMREFLVSGIRSYVESQGLAFGALLTGKIKVFVQYVTLSFLIFCVGHQDVGRWLPTLTEVLVYVMVGVTAASAVQYLFRAVRILKGRRIV